jgi:hypothetical protein
MKKVLFFMSLVAIGTTVHAQSLDAIGEMMNKNQFAAAKTAIDKHLGEAKNANSADGWYYKGRIYNSLSREATTPKADAFTLKENAFDAFKKYQQIAGKTELRMLGENYGSYLDLYLGLYDMGAQQFNDKDYTGAYKSFLKAQVVEDFIFEKKYTYPQLQLNKLDTSLVMNTAAAGLQAGDTVNAHKAYHRIIDANVAGPNYEQVYEYLTSYYKSKKDDVNFKAMLAKGKATYPNSNYWNEIELQNISESGDKTAMFAKYEEIYTKDPANYNNALNYSIEMYNVIYVKDMAGKDVDRSVKIDEVKANKLTTILKSIIPLDKGNEANMLMANHLYAYASNYSQRAAVVKQGKLAKPADLKMKKDLDALTMAKLDELTPYAEKGIKYFAAQTELKSRARANYRALAEYLSETYGLKKDLKKVAEYDKLKASIKL